MDLGGPEGLGGPAVFDEELLRATGRGAPAALLSPLMAVAASHASSMDNSPSFTLSSRRSRSSFDCKEMHRGRGSDAEVSWGRHEMERRRKLATKVYREDAHTSWCKRFSSSVSDSRFIGSTMSAMEVTRVVQERKKQKRKYDNMVSIRGWRQTGNERNSPVIPRFCLSGTCEWTAAKEGRTRSIRIVKMASPVQRAVN